MEHPAFYSLNENGEDVRNMCMSAGIAIAMSSIYEFMQHVDVPVAQPLEAQPGVLGRPLADGSLALQAMAQQYLASFKETRDQRYLRAHLMCEELGEVLQALYDLDRVALVVAAV